MHLQRTESAGIIATPLFVFFVEPLTQSSEICRYFTSQRVGTPQHWGALSFCHFRCVHWYFLFFFQNSCFEDVVLARSLPQSGSLEIRLSAGLLHLCSQLLSSEHLSYAAVRVKTSETANFGGDMRFARAGANLIHTGKACNFFWIDCCGTT